MVLKWVDDFDPSQALWRIDSCSDTELWARTRPGQHPLLVLEAMAQTCGMHLRYRHDFLIQVYLVSVSDLLYSPGAGDEEILIRAMLRAETGAGALYDVAIPGSSICRILMGFGQLPEGNENHHILRERFLCLTGATSWIG